MKKDHSTVFLILVFFVGLSVLLYPTVSDFWNSRAQTRAIVHYEQFLQNISDDESGEMREEADEYNRRLREVSHPLINFDRVGGYEETLDVTGTGIIGTLHIDKIGVELPVYHGTSEGVLNTAVGHVEGSSLPVGGPGTHAVLSAHRGLPSARLFTDLDKVETGDLFTVSVLDQVLTYQVDQILIVLPHEVEYLDIEEGKDYCTLVTCTPYGINSHRLLVRGVRVENVEDLPEIRISAEALQIDPIIVAPAVAAPILLVLLIVLLVQSRKH